MIGDAATGGLAEGVGSFVSGIFGDKGLSKKDQMEIMDKQHGYELENMDYQAKLNEEMAQRNQQRQNEYFGMTAEYNSAKNQKQRLTDDSLIPDLSAFSKEELVHQLLQLQLRDLALFYKDKQDLADQKLSNDRDDRGSRRERVS